MLGSVGFRASLSFVRHIYKVGPGGRIVHPEAAGVLAVQRSLHKHGLRNTSQPTLLAAPCAGHQVRVSTYLLSP